jgi:hypothetical protein
MENYSEIEAAFNAYKRNRTIPDKVKKGWFTTRDMAFQQRIGIRAAQVIIRDLFDRGAVETKKFMIETGTRLYPVVHYKLCKKRTR